LFVAVTAPPGFVVNRLLPARAGAVLPAIRLKLITKKLPLALLSTITPPPWPAAVFPVMVTLESVVVSPEGNPADIPRLLHNPAPSPVGVPVTALLLITVP